MGIDPITAGIGASVLGGIGQASAANKAAKAQKAASDQQVQLYRDIYNDTTKRFQPFYDAGTNALAAYNYELGIGPRPTFGGTAPTITTIEGKGPTTLGDPRFSSGGGVGFPPQGNQDRRQPPASSQTPGTPTRYSVNGQIFDTLEAAQAYANANKTGGTEYGGYTKTPGYDFRLNQGLDAIQSSAAARGGLYSGAAMRDALKYGQDYATGEYTNYLARLAGMTDTGVAAAGNQANAGANMGAGVGSALASRGNASAAGAIGVGNAFNGGLQNVLGYMNYQQNLNGGGMTSSPRPQPNPWY